MNALGFILLALGILLIVIGWRKRGQKFIEALKNG